MKLHISCAVTALTLTLGLQAATRADYLAPDTPAGVPSGSTSVGSVSSSGALTSTQSTNGAPATMVDNHDAGWAWSSMVEYTDPYLYQKSGYAGGPGSYGVYNFHGTGVEITGMAGPSVTLDGVVHTMGSIEVFIDGKQVATNSLHLKETKYRDSIFKIDGLDATNHVLHIEPAGGWIVVNYITVLNTPTQPGTTPTQDQNATTVANNNDQGMRLWPQSSNYCLDVQPGPLKGATVDLYEVDSTRMQTWTINGVGNGECTISPAGYPNMVLWIDPPTPDNKEMQVFLWPYTGAPNELLTMKNIEGLKWEIHAQGDNMLLGVTRQGYFDGSQVYGQAEAGLPGQTWYLGKPSHF